MDISEAIRIIHLEDYKVMRDGIRLLLESDPELILVGEAGDGDSLFELLKSTPADVIIADLFLDGMEHVKAINGFEICKRIRDEYPMVQVLAHSAYEDTDHVSEILTMGAAGFVSKKSGFDELINGIKTVVRGEVYICSRTRERFKNMTGFLAGMESNLKSKDDIFTRQERTILDLISKGKSSREIGERLFINERTVETHRRNMFHKANVKNTAELITYAGSIGLLKR